MDQGSLELVQCLSATLSPDASLRHQAENCLVAWSKHDGYSLRLIGVVQSADPHAADVRQLAAVVLRRHIQKHWALENIEPGSVQISDAEKTQVRALLPASLAEPNGRIQTAVGMSIAEIGKSDCPHAWPELLPGLVSAVSNKSNPHLVAGAVRCLALLVEDLSEEQVVEMAPVVLPELLQIVQSEGVPVSLRRWSLVIFKTCLGALELTYKQSPECAQIVQQALPPWLQTIAVILDGPTTADAPLIWGVKFEALGSLVRAVRAFSKVAAPHMAPILSSCWGLFTSCGPLYDQLVVRGDGDDAGVEEDTSLERVTFSDLVSQLFELLLTVLGNRRMLPMLRPAFQQLAYLTIGYMQVSQENMAKWEADVNEYLANEDDMWGTRASGELLLDEILEAGEEEGLAAVGEAVQRRIQEAAAARQAGDERWWRLREAALLAAGSVSDRCVELRRKGKHVPPAIDPGTAAAALLETDLAPGSNAPAFVVGRALWLFFRWTPALSPEIRSAALRVGCAALAPGCPPLVQAGACQAVSRLCKGASPEDIQAVAEQAFSGLAQLLPSAEEDSLHLVVETLSSLVKVDPGSAVRWSQHVIPAILKVWVDNITDPLLGEDAEELLRLFAATPGCLEILQSTALPTLCDVIINPAPHSPVLIAGCLDVVTLILRPSAAHAAEPWCKGLIPAVLRLLRSTDDEDVMAAAVSMLRTALQVAKTGALTWAGDSPAAGVAAYIQIAHHLLQPDIPDLACRGVGGLILELLRYAASEVAPQLGDLLVAISRKLRTLEDPMAVQSLLSVLAFVANADAAQLVDLLSRADGGTGDGSSALQVAMTKWTERHMEIRTPYDIKMSISALGALLACPHPAVDAVVVKGRRVDTATGIRTRASKQVEQWSQVPLRVKLVMLLADSYIEASTQGGGEGGAGEWGGAGDEEDLDEYDEEEESDEEESEEGLWDEFGMLRGALDDEDGFDYFGELSAVDPLEAARREVDPINALDVAVYVAGAFKEMAQKSPDLMQAAAGELTPTQVKAVQRIWQG